MGAQMRGVALLLSCLILKFSNSNPRRDTIFHKVMLFLHIWFSHHREDYGGLSNDALCNVTTRHVWDKSILIEKTRQVKALSCCMRLAIKQRKVTLSGWLEPVIDWIKLA
jgi:hypothetical protein